MTAPRRLLVVSPNFHGYWRSIERAFTELGYAVTTHRYDERPARLARVGAKVRHELPARIGLTRFGLGDPGDLVAGRTAAALAALDAVDPHRLLVVKGDTLGAAFWDEVDRRKIPRVLWLYDELRRVRHEVPIERLGPIASYSAADTGALQERSFTVAHVPLAFDPTMTPTQPPRTDEVVFVGARYPARERLLVGLAEAGVPVRAYGRDWSGHLVDRVRTWDLHRPSIAAGRDLPRPEAYAVLAGAAAALNIHGDQDGFTMRTFEACGVGGLQLIDRADVTELYTPGEHLEVFGGPAELTALADRALRDRPWSDRLRAAGRAHTMAQHTFVHRARALEALWD